jgi:hypothetical protein
MCVCDIDIDIDIDIFGIPFQCEAKLSEDEEKEKENDKHEIEPDKKRLKVVNSFEINCICSSLGQSDNRNFEYFFDLEESEK